MSIVYTADVFCDGDDCSQWTHGATGSDVPTKTAARRVAKKSKWLHVAGRDYCPTCAKALETNKPG